MSNRTLPIKTADWEDNPATFLARVNIRKALKDAPVLKADITSITVQVTDEQGTVTLASTAVDKNTAVYDTIQPGGATDDIWRADSVGFNFDHTVPASAFPKAGTYRVEYLFTLTGAVTRYLVFEHTAMEVVRS